MKKLKLKDLSVKYKMIDLIMERRVHELIDIKMSVYYEDVLYDGNRTWIHLIVGDNYVHNSISFPSSISREDLIVIADEIMSQYIDTCDLEELNMELRGEVPCTEHKGKYSSCAQCHEKECLGVTYSLSGSFDHMHIQNNWNEKYGEGSEANKTLLLGKAIDAISNFAWECGKSEEYLGKLLEKLENHPNIDCEVLNKIFKK